MASLLRMLAARCRQSVLGRSYGGVPGGDGPRRGTRDPGSGRARADSAGGGGSQGGGRRGQRGHDDGGAQSGASGDQGSDGARRGTRGPRSGRSRSRGGDDAAGAGRRRSQDAGRADSAGGGGSQGGGRRGQRGHDDGGAQSHASGDQGRSFWARIRDRLRGARSTEDSPNDGPGFREVFDDVEDTVELLERMEALPGRVYNLGIRFQDHIVNAGISLGAGAILLKGKFEDTFSSVKERLSSVKETVMARLSPKKARPAREGGDGSIGYPVPGPLDFSM